jgi:hypothetical protein
MRCLCAWGLCLSGEQESNAVFECLGDYALSGEQESNAVFECLGTMPVCGAGKKCGVWERTGRKPCPLALFVCLGTMLCRRERKQCVVWVPGDYACLWNKKAVRCLRAWGQCLSGKRKSNALFESGAVVRLGRLLCL